MIAVALLPFAMTSPPSRIALSFGAIRSEFGLAAHAETPAPYFPPKETICQPYHDAALCLEAIKAATRHCIQTRFGGLPDNGQILACLLQALQETGVTSEPDDGWEDKP